MSRRALRQHIASRESERPGGPAQPRSTCPWGTDDQETTTGAARSRSTQNTCPWGDQRDNDQDSKALASAAKKRQPGGLGVAPWGVDQKDLARRSPVAQGLQSPWAVEQVAHARLPPAPQDPPGDGEPDEEAEAAERMAIIGKCMDQGLSDEETYGVLEEHEFQKTLRREQAAQRGGAPAKEASLVAGKRQQQPHDASSCRTSLSLAERRAKTREASEASVGGFDENHARQANLQSHEAAAAAKSRNRGGQGIF